ERRDERHSRLSEHDLEGQPPRGRQIDRVRHSLHPPEVLRHVRTPALTLERVTQSRGGSIEAPVHPDNCSAGLQFCLIRLALAPRRRAKPRNYSDPVPKRPYALRAPAEAAPHARKMAHSLCGLAGGTAACALRNVRQDPVELIQAVV